jgi:anaerobic selenocysteine-containing dehydrogenase/Fe-S-cluster-containing dehydrogenase component
VVEIDNTKQLDTTVAVAGDNDSVAASLGSETKSSENSNGSSAVTRRGFFKILGSTAAAGTVAACAPEKNEKIIPRVHNQDRHIPGVPLWYSTICTECFAGCGVDVRTVDGRAIKAEGNKLNPINTGSLCALGQSSLQNLYDPDRVRTPLKKIIDSETNQVRFEGISWDEANALIVEAMKASNKKGSFLTGELSGSISKLVGKFADVNALNHYTYDPSLPYTLAKATKLVYGYECIPEYHFNKADTILSFGADFLTTWISPVEYAKDWSERRRSEMPSKLVQLEPRLSSTGAKADLWSALNPGTEVRVALVILNKLMSSGRGRALERDLYRRIKTLVAGLEIDSIAEESGVSKEKLLLIVDLLLEAENTLVVPGGISSETSSSLSLAVVVQLINLVLGNVGRTLTLGRVRRIKSSPSDIFELLEKLEKGVGGVFFVYDANPSYTLPNELGFNFALKKADFVVALSAQKTETAALADVILPIHTNFESWGDNSPFTGVYGLQQPTMLPVFESKDVGDLLLTLSEQLGNSLWPKGEDKSFYGYLSYQWKKLHKNLNVGTPFPVFWKECLERGGFFQEIQENNELKAVADEVFGLSFLAATFSFGGFKALAKKEDLSNHATTHGDAHSGIPTNGNSGLVLVPFYTVKSLDGRAANRPWMQELPDPMTAIVWDTWAEIHPDVATSYGVKTGDLIVIRNSSSELLVPVYTNKYISKKIIAVPLGQGHSEYGRYAKAVKGGNVYSLLSPDFVPEVSSPLYVGSVVEVTRSRLSHTLVSLSGSDSQEGRDLAKTVVLSGKPTGADNGSHSKSEVHGEGSAHTGHHEVKQMYKQRVHPLYEWGMTVDLAACTACSACVVACHAENNVPVVGKKLCEKGREMSWIRIERYYDNADTHPRSTSVNSINSAFTDDPRVSFLPMFCQHCNNAPCEPVCPVYATYHNEEGLNVMVYNRCVGTRYCSNNCSYKVRRFNWVEFDYPEPLNWQLNPFVTKRGAGVMEKCSFCVQRIISAKDEAKDLGRLVKDGEIEPACVQTCPTKALTFGNLLDSESNVAKKSRNTRAYKILDHHINTQPSVSYLANIKVKV